MRPFEARRRLVGVLLAGVFLAFAARATAADPSPKEIRERIDAVAKLIAMGKPDDARASLAVGIEGLRAMQAKPEMATGFKILAGRATAARKALEAAGVDVATLDVPTAAVPAAVPSRPAAPRAAVAAGVSFTRQVAPLLVRSCGGCHVTGRRGNFQMATYQALIQSGMVQRGAGNASRLVEVILTGDMPRGGGKVSPEEVGALISWIDRGAICDGDPTAGLDRLVRGGAVPPPPAPAVPTGAPAPLKPGDIAFSTEVAPILIDRCGKCHGDRDPENNFAITTLTSLVKGGRSGPAIVPGKGEESLLVKKLRGAGIEGQRMPLNAPPLPDADIATIAKWIDQGARIDLLTATDPIEKLVATGKSRRLSDDALAKVRREAAEKLWARMIPDEPPVVDRRDGLVIIGNLPESRLRELGDTAAGLLPAIRRELVGANGSLLKGGVVLYAFRNSYDYSSLWQVVLNGERPKGISGNAGMAGDVVYGAILVPTQDDSGDSTKLLAAEQIAGATLAGRGFPAWFCQGAGRAVAIKIVPKAPLVQEWKNDVGAAIRQLGSAQDFLAGHADPSATALAAGGFLTSLAPPGKIALVVGLVDTGTSFDDAFAKVFRSTPEQAFTAWAARNAGR
jgi:mono/diheme cytochrome c family protein